MPWPLFPGPLAGLLGGEGKENEGRRRMGRERRGGRGGREGKNPKLKVRPWFDVLSLYIPQTGQTQTSYHRRKSAEKFRPP